MENEDFLRLYAESNHRIYTFILCVLPARGDAEEVFQRTSIVLWRKFGEFSPGTDFFRWACRVAQLEALGFLRERQRDRHRFDEHLVARIADDRIEREGLLRQRTDALADCLGQLRDGERRILALYYDEGMAVPDIAELNGKKTFAMYKHISKIRATLRRCIDARLATEGWA